MQNSSSSPLTARYQCTGGRRSVGSRWGIHMRNAQTSHKDLPFHTGTRHISNRFINQHHTNLRNRSHCDDEMCFSLSSEKHQIKRESTWMATATFRIPPPPVEHMWLQCDCCSCSEKKAYSPQRGSHVQFWQTRSTAVGIIKDTRKLLICPLIIQH